MGQISSSLDSLSLKQTIAIPAALVAQSCLIYKIISNFNNNKKTTQGLEELFQKINADNKTKNHANEREELETIAKNTSNQEPIISERQQAKHEEADVFKICITGGPCGGKTSGLVYVQEKMKELGYQVFIVPEAATLIFNGGGMLDMKEYNKAQAISFQTNLLKLQIRLENSMTSIAKLSKKKSIVLCDRGLMDGSAYVDPSEWAELLEVNHLNEVLMRDDRYDLVIHLVSTAVDAPKFYHQHNQARMESIEEASNMDKKTQQAWLGHPNHCIISNNVKSFEEKLQLMLNSVKQCVGIETSTQKFTRKYLIKPWGIIANPLAKRLKAQTFYIEDVFLEVDLEQDNQKAIKKLRRRGQNQNYAYILSSSMVDKTSKTEQNREIQYKKLLSFREYTLMLIKADSKRNNLITQREVFLYKGNMFILDTYLNIKEGFNILKVILKEENQSFEMPPQLQVVKEITGDLGYKRSTISKKDWYFSKGDARLLMSSSSEK